MKKPLSRKVIRLAIDTVFGFLTSRVKTAAALAAVGLDRVLDPARPLPDRTGLVVLLGVLAVLDVLAHFGLVPDLCTPDRPCEECLQFVEEQGFYPYGAACPAPLYLDEKEADR
ncbi:hypothetical protein ACFWXO_36810 [Kitasatospora sp. NPDC059088]|uniref:hypothetical protein n=1 Tax=Kitasatospora sp. NPDC059088 TaxID=3346722 RepID=UPI0036D0EE4A